MASTFQIRKIHTLKNILGLEDDLYRDMLMSFGVQSSTRLTFTEATVLIDIFEEKAERLNLWTIRQKKYRDLKRDSNMATGRQLGMIEGLWREICYVDNSDFAKKSLRKFLQNKFGIADVTFLTKNKAIKVIQAILNIKNKSKRWPTGVVEK